MNRWGCDLLTEALFPSRVVLKKPALDVLSLSCYYHALPVHLPGALIILTHQVGLLIEHLNCAVRLGPAEVELGWSDVSFHLPVYTAHPKHKGRC